ncbi:MAG: hypothetical protein A2W93_11495 [Bacteroidetes bacterium GWF2_43_63]|nr:MAG: hypothetical protein A2W94_14370 [Bacteroidetes bacterium GWE2_42_42]OFY54894.1 MAG: hypothetical protein A2W93_11495 [Bacteroidetes bacterium GWF2_43_63]HCB63198.1 hypothetical protein [Bacteroidales bacterium]HCY22197.1 hypothetical protein [Bacteroidales bacterium]
MMFFRLISLIVLFLVATTARSQIVSGIVKDGSGLPVPGATVMIKNSYTGVVADENGRWQLKVQPGKNVLTISMLGYVTIEKELVVPRTGTSFEAVLQNAVTQLNEALIVADTRDLGKEIMQKVRDKRRLYLGSLDKYQCRIDRKLSLMRDEPRDMYDSIRKATADSLGAATNIDLLKTPKERRAERKAERKQRKVERKKRKELSDSVKTLNDTVRVQHIGDLSETILSEISGNGSTREIISAENTYELADIEDFIYVSIGYEEEGMEIDHIQFVYSSPYMIFSSAEDWNFNFYEAQLRKEMLCQQPLVSPLSPMGPTLYKYDYAGLHYDDSTKIFRIKVTPLFPNDALFTGYIYIRDSVFCLDEVDLTIDPRALTMVNSFRIHQKYVLMGSTHSVPSETTIEYGIIEGRVNQVITGTSLFSAYNFNSDSTVFPRHSLEMVRYEDVALERDSTWWTMNRKIPLTNQELIYSEYVDSLRNVFSGEEFTRKLDSAYNHIDVWSFLIKGIRHRNRERQTEYYIGALPTQVNFFGIGGYRHNLNGSFNKRFKNDFLLDVDGDINYGFSNQDLRGRVGVGLTYVPKKFVRTYFRFGDYYDMINNNPSITSAFSRSNYARTKMFAVSQRMEIINGLFGELTLEHSDQQAISDMNMDSWSNLIFGEINEPIDFDRYVKSEFKLNLVYRIRQRYMFKGNRKILLGSKYPDLTFTWRKGVPGLLNSEVNYDYLEFGASDYVKLNRYGTSNWSFLMGSYVNKNNLRILENKFFRGSDDFFFSNPLESFQLLGPTLSTNSTFVRGNYIHHFEGIFDKVPLLGRLKLSVAAGGGFLLMDENNFRHGEFFAGLEKPIRIRRELFRLGVYAVTSDNSITKADFTLKFGVSFYNAFRKKWDY